MIIIVNLLIFTFDYFLIQILFMSNLEFRLCSFSFFRFERFRRWTGHFHIRRRRHSSFSFWCCFLKWNRHALRCSSLFSGLNIYVDLLDSDILSITFRFSEIICLRRQVLLDDLLEMMIFSLGNWDYL